MVIIDPRTGEAHEVTRSSIDNDNWYLYDRDADSIVEDGGPKQEPDHTQTPRGLEWIRGKKLKFSIK